MVKYVEVFMTPDPLKSQLPARDICFFFEMFTITFTKISYVKHFTFGIGKGPGHA